MTTKESTDPTLDRHTSQVVRFSVGAQQYAVDIMQVKEIINPVPISPMPQAPRFVEGIIELRGAFLAVIDLRRRFGSAIADFDRDTKYIVVHRAGRYAGLIVDRVIDVRHVAARELEEAPALALGQDARFVSGVTKIDGDLVLFCDLERLLDERALAELDDLTA